MNEAIADLDAEISKEQTASGKARKREHEKRTDSVRHRIKDLMQVLKNDHPALYDHLERFLHIGMECRYDPNPEQEWDIQR